jgi:hypothetical protein
MTDQASLTSQPLVLQCPNHGNVDWEGDVFCKHCNKIYVCSEIAEDEDGVGIFGFGAKRKYVYPDADPKGMCSCDKRLFGGTDFTARPMCHECAIAVMQRVAAKEGKVFWTTSPHTQTPENPEDYADPYGDRSYELYAFENGDHWVWEVSWNEREDSNIGGHCSGTANTQAQARAFAEKIYKAIAPT